MKKFDIWNNTKKGIDQKEIRALFKEREIFFAHIWENVWFEQNWKWAKFVRPVLIFKKFNKEVFWWIPLTSKKKEWKFYYSFLLNWKENKAILSQLKLIDSKRLIRKIWVIEKEKFLEIKKSVLELVNSINSF